MVACTQDASMPVCESDGGAAAAVLVVVDCEHSCWASRWVECGRHVGMWYTDRRVESHATGSSKGYLGAAHSLTTHAHLGRRMGVV